MRAKRAASTLNLRRVVLAGAVMITVPAGATRLFPIGELPAKASNLNGMWSFLMLGKQHM